MDALTVLTDNLTLLSVTVLVTIACSLLRVCRGFLVPSRVIIRPYRPTVMFYGLLRVSLVLTVCWVVLIVVGQLLALTRTRMTPASVAVLWWLLLTRWVTDRSRLTSLWVVRMLLVLCWVTLRSPDLWVLWLRLLSWRVTVRVPLSVRALVVRLNRRIVRTLRLRRVLMIRISLGMLVLVSRCKVWLR